MKIDGNELAIRQNELDQQGFKKEAYEMKMEFLRQVRESGDRARLDKIAKNTARTNRRQLVGVAYPNDSSTVW